MEPIIIMNSNWGNNPFIPLYLFFGGLTGGIFIISVVADLIGIRHKQYENLSKLTAYIDIPILGLAGFFIIFHLGQPGRGLALWNFTNIDSSWMARGGFVVLFASIFTVGYAALWYFGVDQKIRRIIGVVGIPVLGFMAIYTGLLLSGAMFVPLWSRHFLPTLFLNSGILGGLAGIGLIAVLTSYFRAESEHLGGVLRVLSFAVAVVILLEFSELYMFMNHLATDSGAVVKTGNFFGPKGRVEAFEYVTQGPLAVWFWLGIIGLGLSLPFVITLIGLIFDRLIQPYIKLVALANFTLILVGGAILRFVIVW
ncbi:MAG: polysulfide reductase NrfD, partial [SAR324 cluster bacterium]|nr:polysulfide reductase NrfD [SAR324 cluster bacterium]